MNENVSAGHFYHLAYSSFLPEFIDKFSAADGGDGRFSHIVRLFASVLDMEALSVAVFWLAETDSGDEVKAVFCESSVLSDKELDGLAAYLDKNRAGAPFSAQPRELCAEVIVPVLVIPICAGNALNGYTAAFFHGNERLLDVEDPKVKFLSRAMNIASLVYRRGGDEERLERLLMNDFLTELPNWTYLSEAMVYCLQTAETFRIKFGLLIVRVMSLKHINNSLGISTGDVMLKKVGSLIKSAMTEKSELSEAVAGRLIGGDFAVVLTFPAGDDDTIVRTCCEAIIEKTRGNIEVNGYRLYPSVCIGASVFPQHGETVEELLRKADIAKSAAKNEGSNSYKIYDEFMDGGTKMSLFLNSNFPIAVTTNQFELFYQAQVDVRTGGVVGAEALIRWNHPERGLMFPGDFIEFAEKSGYGIALDLLVIDMACEQINKWREKGLGIRVSVNISPKHFENGLIFDSVTKVLNKHSIDPSMLQIELLESVVLNGFSAAVKVIENLRAQGVAVALDDFGSGYSSLEYVAKLPMDYLKIDRTFCMNLSDNPSNKIILQTIATLAKGMGVKTIVEGVETAEHLAFLKSIGCDIAQSYFISKPIPVGKFEEFLERLSP